MKIYFEITVGNILRYNASAYKISEGDVFFVYDLQQDYKKSLNICVSYQSMNYNQLKKAMSTYGASELVINSFRLTDCAAICAAQELGMTVTYVQHGFYQPYVKRGFSFFLSIRKAFFFLYLFFTAFGLTKISMSYPLALMGIVDRALFSKKHLIIEKGLFWSDYWIRWHTERSWCFSKEKLISSDANKTSVSYSFNDSSRLILFVSQSLVEDGRLSLAKYVSTCKLLSEAILKSGHIPLIRFHPRQSDKVKGRLLELGFLTETDTTLELKACVGGYSSLLPAIHKCGVPIYLIKLDKERLPESIAILGREEKLTSIDFENLPDLADKEVINYYWGS